MWEYGWGEDRCWPPPVLSRFVGGPRPSAPPLAEMLYVPSSYDQPITGAAVASPLPIMQDPTQGQFARGTGVAAGAIGGAVRPEYIPGYSHDARIHQPGGMAIGLSPLGWRRAYHGTLTLTTTVDGQGKSHTIETEVAL